MNVKVIWKRRRKHLTSALPPSTPATPVGYYYRNYPVAFQLFDLQKTKTSKRKNQTLSELNYYPVQVVNTYFPEIAEPFKAKFKRKLRTVPELNYYPQPVVYAVNFPELLYSFKVSFKRKQRNVPELNYYPATPAWYYTGYFPGSLATSLPEKTKGTRYSVALTEFVFDQAPPVVGDTPVWTEVTPVTTAWATETPVSTTWTTQTPVTTTWTEA